MLLVDVLQYLACITLCLPTGISLSNTVRFTLEQCTNPRPRISSAFSGFIGILSTMFSCYIYPGQHRELANLCSEVYLEAHTVDTNALKVCCQTSREENKRSFFDTRSPRRL